MQNVDCGAYVVLRVYKSITPSVLFTTQNRQDALQYAQIMKRTEPNYDYAVSKVEVLFHTEE